MLHFEDTLFVCSPLLTFVSSVASISGGCTIRWCMGVEDSDIKEVFAFVPEILGLDVKSCAFLSIGASEGESLSSQRLESGFDTNIWAYLREKLCSDVSLCRMEGMAPFGQLNAWLTLNGWPHGQCVASLAGVQSNLRQRASLKACL